MFTKMDLLINEFRNNMNLVELSKKLGFKSTHVNPEYYALWMCELQKWIREDYGVHIEIASWEDDTWSAQLVGSRL